MITLPILSTFILFVALLTGFLVMMDVNVAMFLSKYAFWIIVAIAFQALLNWITYVVMARGR